MRLFIYSGGVLTQKRNDVGIFEFDAINGNKYKANCAVRNKLGEGITSKDTFDVKAGKVMLTMFEYEDPSNVLGSKYQVRDKIADASQFGFCPGATHAGAAAPKCTPKCKRRQMPKQLH